MVGTTVVQHQASKKNLIPRAAGLFFVGIILCHYFFFTKRQNDAYPKSNSELGATTFVRLLKEEESILQM
jgi:hypothetical protein